MKRHEEMLEKLGFTYFEEHDGSLSASMETGRGPLEVMISRLEDGLSTARVRKPNGSVKFLYSKTDAQMGRALIQTIEANRR